MQRKHQSTARQIPSILVWVAKTPLEANVIPKSPCWWVCDVCRHGLAWKLTLCAASEAGDDRFFSPSVAHAPAPLRRFRPDDPFNQPEQAVTHLCPL